MAKISEQTGTAPDAHNSTNSEAQERFQKRRRLLKGTSLALPAVMTVHAPSAWAQAFESITCAEKGLPDLPGFNDAVSSGMDDEDILRHSVEVVTVVVNDAPDPDNDQNLRDIVGYRDSNGTWREPPSGNELMDLTGYDFDALEDNHDRVVSWDSAEGYAVAYIDVTNGAVMGYGMPRGPDQPTGTNATSAMGDLDGCYESLTG